MKRRVPIIFASALASAVALGSFAATVKAQDYDHDHGYSEFHGFVPGSIVLSGTVYVGNAGTVVPGEVLPPGCQNTGPVTNPNPATVNVPLLPADQTSTTTTRAGELRFCQR